MLPLCSLQRLTALVTTIVPEQAGVKLVDELSRGLAQIAATGHQLSPETFGRRFQRHRTKCVANLPQQDR